VSALPKLSSLELIGANLKVGFDLDFVTVVEQLGELFQTNKALHLASRLMSAGCDAKMMLI
jgi:hypothetical protein